ncbi:MAG TPA: efflux transporter outer membrane subunit [Steroidobacteraceae bacterium]|nr:efflux transporter outer membrane subunit [Steroidobacteraceae bacterium]
MVLEQIPKLIPALVAATLAACAVGPDYHRPTVHTAPTFVEAEPALYSTDDSIGPFWGQFNDDLLNGLVIEALSANHDLRIALAHLQQSRALRTQARLDLLPTVTSQGGYTRQQYPAVESFGVGTLQQSYYNAGFDATWELDLFGRVRRGVEAARAQVEGQEATLRDAQVSVTAEVARTYFELRGEQAELAVLERNAANQRQTVELTNSLLDAGRGTELDTSRAKAQLDSTLATIPPLRASVEKSIHRLGVLTGREPDALAALLEPTGKLPDLPKMAAVGDPAGLLRRRPDIRIAERRLAASTAQIGVAVGDLFPKVTFTGNFGFAAGDLSALGSSPSKTFLIGPSISWPAFDLGRVRARIAGARAGADADLAAYQQTVLKALEETENALVAHARARDRLVQLTAAAQESATAAQIAQARYQGGLVGFLDVLDAERAQLQSQDQLAQSRTDAATSLIAVYKALGGGWEGAPLPVARVTTATPPQR